jgi:hypothetical protein
MDWLQLITIAGTNLLIMLTFFVCTISLNISGRDDCRAITESVNKAMKDFHGRLCSIEERRKDNG